MLTILEGHCLEKLREMADNSVDSCVTDPPYELTTGKKGGSGPASLNVNSPAGRARVTTGFMGKAWDGTGIAFNPELWREVLRVLKPGAHLVSFGGTRTYHRMACAIEDAGFEIRDQLAWIYGSGFPKSSNQSGVWAGWGTALKPAWEPIVLARKPLIGTVPANLAAHGVGAINIDGCRVDGAKGTGNWDGDRSKSVPGELYEGGFKPGFVRPQNPDGRWPANLMHDGSEEVLESFPDSDGQQGDLKGHSKDRLSKGIFGDMKAARDALARNDDGSAARFFYCAKASVADREAGLAEAGLAETTFARSGGAQNAEKRGENYDAAQSIGLNRVDQRRNIHPTVKPTDLMRWLCRLVTPPGGTIIDPFMGSGSTGRGAILEGFSFIGIEKEAQYIPIATARIREAEGELFSQ